MATPATVNFSVELVKEVSSKFKSTLFSTGGDEVNLPCYEDDPQTQADLAESGQTIDEALNAFILAEHAVIRAQGKTPIVKEGKRIKIYYGFRLMSFISRYDLEAQHVLA